MRIYGHKYLFCSRVLNMAVPVQVIRFPHIPSRFIRGYPRRIETGKTVKIIEVDTTEEIPVAHAVLQSTDELRTPWSISSLLSHFASTKGLHNISEPVTGCAYAIIVKNGIWNMDPIFVRAVVTRTLFWKHLYFCEIIDFGLYDVPVCPGLIFSLPLEFTYVHPQSTQISLPQLKDWNTWFLKEQLCNKKFYVTSSEQVDHKTHVKLATNFDNVSEHRRDIGEYFRLISTRYQELYALQPDFFQR